MAKSKQPGILEIPWSPATPIDASIAVLNQKIARYNALITQQKMQTLEARSLLQEIEFSARQMILSEYTPEDDQYHPVRIWYPNSQIATQFLRYAKIPGLSSIAQYNFYAMAKQSSPEKMQGYPSKIQILFLNALKLEETLNLEARGLREREMSILKYYHSLIQLNYALLSYLTRTPQSSKRANPLKKIMRGVVPTNESKKVLRSLLENTNAKLYALIDQSHILSARYRSFNEMNALYFPEFLAQGQIDSLAEVKAPKLLEIFRSMYYSDNPGAVIEGWQIPDKTIEDLIARIPTLKFKNIEMLNAGNNVYCRISKMGEPTRLFRIQLNPVNALEIEALRHSGVWKYLVEEYLSFSQLVSQDCHYAVLSAVEYLPNGSLAFLSQNIPNADSIAHRQYWATQLLSQVGDFLLALSQETAYHSDIKLSNFLTLKISNDQYKVKLSDLKGLHYARTGSLKTVDKVEFRTDVTGHYAPPEFFDQTQTSIDSEKFMSYGFGVALYAFLTAKGDDPEWAIDYQDRGHLDFSQDIFKDACGAKLQKLCQKLLHKDSLQRMLIEAANKILHQLERNLMPGLSSQAELNSNKNLASSQGTYSFFKLPERASLDKDSFEQKLSLLRQALSADKKLTPFIESFQDIEDHYTRSIQENDLDLQAVIFEALANNLHNINAFLDDIPSGSSGLSQVLQNLADRIRDIEDDEVYQAHSPQIHPAASYSPK